MLALVAVTGLTFAVRHLITDERIKSVVVPMAEKSLGRTVDIGEIKVGLLSGITINDFKLKEADGNGDFVHAGAFVLRYDLMPLWKKKLVINEISLKEATLQIVRDKNGVFNYSSLTVFSEPSPQPAAGDTVSRTAALPLALTMDQIRLEQIKLIVRDEQKELPDLDATADATVSFVFGSGLTDFSYTGTFSFVADAVYGEARPELSGSGTFDRENLSLTANTVIDQQEIKIDAKARGYAATPDVTLNVTSPRLNIDKLLALSASLPNGKKSDAPPARQPPAAEKFPPGFVARGKVAVGEAIHNRIAVTDFTLDYTLKEGILTISDMKMNSYGGQTTSNAEIDINHPEPAYKGTVSLQAIEATALSSALSTSASELISGALAGSFSFDGAGTQWEKIRNVLTADGTFSLTNGQIKDTEIASAIASLLGLPELGSLAFDEIDGTFRLIKGGKVSLQSDLKSTDVQAETSGTVGLDGSLDLPLVLTLSPALSEKLRSKTSYARYLSNDQGGTTLNMKITGTAKNPVPTMDSSSLASQARQGIKQKLIEKVGDKMGGSTTESKPLPASDLIKGLFGR